ncbi:MAG: MarR family transcriptional regulator [Actinomycetota bacterium]|nr:MarR family transcriptional regulator [Actinomycetota bacterium]
MQAPISAPQGSAQELAADLLTLWRHVLQGGMPAAYRLLEELDLSLTQVKLLHALIDDEATVKELSERLGLSLAGTSRAVDALVGRGLIDRQEDPDDRRMKRVRVTQDARAALVRLDEARLAGLEAFTATLPTSQRRRLIAALRPILDDLAERT